MGSILRHLYPLSPNLILKIEKSEAVDVGHKMPSVVRTINLQAAKDGGGIFNNFVTNQIIGEVDRASVHSRLHSTARRVIHIDGACRTTNPKHSTFRVVRVIVRMSGSIIEAGNIPSSVVRIAVARSDVIGRIKAEAGTKS